MATEHQQQTNHNHHHHQHNTHHQNHHHHHHQQQHRRHQNQNQQHHQQAHSGPPHYVDLHVNAGECVSLQLLDGQEQVVAGPATITMVSQQPTPPVPIPVQVPPGHMIHQIADEKGTLKHIILSVMGADDGSQMESTVINLPQGTFRIDSHGELVSTETNAGSLTTLPQQVYFANYDGCPIAYDATSQVEAVIPLQDSIHQQETQTTNSAKQVNETIRQQHHHHYNLDQQEAPPTEETANNDKSEELCRELNDETGVVKVVDYGTAGTASSNNKNKIKNSKEMTQQQQRATEDRRSSSRGSDSSVNKRGDSSKILAAKDTNQTRDPSQTRSDINKRQVTTLPDESDSPSKGGDTTNSGAVLVVEQMIAPDSISDTSAYTGHHHQASGPGDLSMSMVPPTMSMSTVDGQLYGYPPCCCCCYIDPQEAVVDGAQPAQALPDLTNQQDVIMEAANGIGANGRNGHSSNSVLAYPMIGAMQTPIALPMGLGPADVMPSMQAGQNGMPIQASSHHMNDSSKGHGGGVKGRGGGYGKHKILSNQANHQSSERQSSNSFNNHYNNQPSYNNIVSGHRNNLSSSAPAYKMPVSANQELSSSSSSNVMGSNSYQAPIYSHHSNYSNHNNVPIALGSAIPSTTSSQKTLSTGGQQTTGANLRGQQDSDNYVQRSRELAGYSLANNYSSSNDNNNSNFGVNNNNNVRHQQNQSNNEGDKRIANDKSASGGSATNLNQQGNSRYTTSNVKVISDNNNQASNNVTTSTQSASSMSPIRARTKGPFSSQHHHNQHHPANGIRSNHQYANSMNHQHHHHHHHHQQQYHHHNHHQQQHQSFEPVSVKDNANNGSHHYRNDNIPVTYHHQQHHVRPSVKGGIAHNEYNINSGASMSNNKHHNQQQHISNPTISASTSGKGAWQSGGSKVILNNSQARADAAADIEASKSNGSRTQQHPSNVAQGDRQQVDEQSKHRDVSDQKLGNRGEQKKCQNNQSRTDTGRTNKNLNNGKLAAKANNDPSRGDKTSATSIRADSKSRLNREPSLASSHSQTTKSSSQQKRVKENAKDKSQKANESVSNQTRESSDRAEACKSFESGDQTGAKLADEMASKLTVVEAQATDSTPKSTPSKRSSESADSESHIGGPTTNTVNLKGKSGQIDSSQPAASSVDCTDTNEADNCQDESTKSDTDRLQNSDTIDPQDQQLDETDEDKSVLLLVTTSDPPTLGSNFSNQSSSINISMRNSFSENNIQSLEAATNQSSVKSTQTTPQRVVSSTGVAAMESGYRNKSGSSTDVSRKGDKRRGSTGGKSEQNAKLSSLPQLRILNLNCSSVTSNSVQLRWSYIQSMADKYGINTHHNPKNAALADHFIIESSCVKQSDTDSLVAPKIVYQGCSYSCRINQLSADKIYHFRVRRTALLAGTSKTDTEGIEHLVVSEILSVTLPSNNGRQHQQHSTGVSGQQSGNNNNNRKLQTASQRTNQSRGSSDAEGHHELSNHLSAISTSSSSGHNHAHRNTNTSSSHNSNHNSHHGGNGNGNKSNASQPVKFSNLVRQCRNRMGTVLGRLVQNSLSSYSETKFAGLLLALFTSFAMLLAIFIHIYIVAPVTD